MTDLLYAPDRLIRWGWKGPRRWATAVSETETGQRQARQLLDRPRQRISGTLNSKDDDAYQEYRDFLYQVGGRLNPYNVFFWHPQWYKKATVGSWDGAVHDPGAGTILYDAAEETALETLYGPGLKFLDTPFVLPFKMGQADEAYPTGPLDVDIFADPFTDATPSLVLAEGDQGGIDYKGQAVLVAFIPSGGFGVPDPGLLKITLFARPRLTVINLNDLDDFDYLYELAQPLVDVVIEAEEYGGRGAAYLVPGPPTGSPPPSGGGGVALYRVELTRVDGTHYTIPGTDSWVALSIWLYKDGQFVAPSGYSVGGTGNRTITLAVEVTADQYLEIIGAKA